MYADPQADKGFKFKFKQQILKAWQPIPTLTKSIILFFILSAIFIPIGIVLQVYGNRITQFVVRYDDTCGSQTTCTMNINIPTTMTGPVYVYYELHNFYQNHRIYVRSIDESQLRGNYRAVNKIGSCDPITLNSHLNTQVSITGAPLDPNGPANPCGLIAFTVFNDTYTLSNGTALTILDDGIDWPSDDKFFQAKLPDQMWLNTSNERVRVWMRVAALPNFRKIWGRIPGTVQAGTYVLTIQNVYNVTSIEGKKFFVLSQANGLGGRNLFLSIMYFIVGGICFVLAITFLILKCIKNKNQVPLNVY